MKRNHNEESTSSSGIITIHDIPNDVLVQYWVNERNPWYLHIIKLVSKTWYKIAHHSGILLHREESENMRDKKKKKDQQYNATATDEMVSGKKHPRKTKLLNNRAIKVAVWGYKFNLESKIVIPINAGVDLGNYGLININKSNIPPNNKSDQILPHDLIEIDRSTILNDMIKMKLPMNLICWFFVSFWEKRTILGSYPVWTSEESENHLVQLLQGCKSTIIEYGCLDILKWLVQKGKQSILTTPDVLFQDRQYSAIWCPTLLTLASNNPLIYTRSKTYSFAKQRFSIFTIVDRFIKMIHDAIKYNKMDILDWLLLEMRQQNMEYLFTYSTFVNHKSVMNGVLLDVIEHVLIKGHTDMLTRIFKESKELQVIDDDLSFMTAIIPHLYIPPIYPNVFSQIRDTILKHRRRVTYDAMKTKNYDIVKMLLKLIMNAETFNNMDFHVCALLKAKKLNEGKMIKLDYQTYFVEKEKNTLMDIDHEYELQKIYLELSINLVV